MQHFCAILPSLSQTGLCSLRNSSAHFVVDPLPLPLPRTVPATAGLVDVCADVGVDVDADVDVDEDAVAVFGA